MPDSIISCNLSAWKGDTPVSRTEAIEKAEIDPFVAHLSQNNIQVARFELGILHMYFDFKRHQALQSLPEAKN